MALKVTKEEWEDWKAHPVTLVLEAYLKARRQALMEQWAAGQFQNESKDVTQIANQNALSEIHVATEIIELEFEQVSEVLRDE